MAVHARSADDIVSQLRRDNADITAAVVVTPDGFALATDTAPEVSADMLAALAADLMARASHNARELGQGGIEELLARAETGYLVIARVDAEQALACLANSEATLGLLWVSIHQAAEALSEIV